MLIPKGVVETAMKDKRLKVRGIEPRPHVPKTRVRPLHHTLSWKLSRTKQCAKCPWRKDVNARDIPNGYSEEKHCALKSTIANPDDVVASIMSPSMRVMACHEDHKAHCIGWLMNQLGDGNNITLRMKMLSCENWREVRLTGAQHERFEDTLPR